MVSCARATRGRNKLPSLDTRSGRPSSLPSRETREELWTVQREKTPGTFFCAPRSREIRLGLRCETRLVGLVCLVDRTGKPTR
jgi:hypothetical protein